MSIGWNQDEGDSTLWHYWDGVQVTSRHRGFAPPTADPSPPRLSSASPGEPKVLASFEPDGQTVTSALLQVVGVVAAAGGIIGALANLEHHLLRSAIWALSGVGGGTALIALGQMLVYVRAMAINTRRATR